ncbi:MAG TPA: hypothetical protein VIA06_01195 [Candidatus Dormibacteraeota bacterium]|jgi:hypothetical protein|nr:hypothetical protein [Candidatus Dormibacteraeota bacterium]
MAYELWDGRSGNFIDSGEAEAEAPRRVHEGDTALADLLLATASLTVSEGTALLRRARRPE